MSRRHPIFDPRPTVLACGILLGLCHGNAQAAKDITPIPANPTPGLRLEVAKTTARIGDEQRFCFTTDQSGYVTLWDIGTSGRVARIYPNAYSGRRAGWVKAGQRQCVGNARQDFRFRVDGPPGMEDVYLVWSRAPENQPRHIRFSDARGLNQALKDLSVEPRARWATAKVTFEITQNGSAEPPTLPQTPVRAVVNGNVYILAMGANVAPLTKTNADARRFAQRMGQVLKVPDSHIKVIENVSRRQFRDGMIWLREHATPGDLVLVFFSGHGSNIKDDNDDEADGLDEVFIPIDVERTATPSDDDIVRDDTYAQWVNAIPTQRIISVLDTCHSGGLQKSLDIVPTGARAKFLSKGPLGTSPPHAQYLRQKDLAGGIDGDSIGEPRVKGLVLAAAAEDQKAMETTGGGLFVTTLLDEIGQGGGNLLQAFQRASERVRQRASQSARQTPTAVGDTHIAETIQLR